ncbi:MAG TPA: (deoxy)nucleoside triphosphate pyrophosphohydrolase [Verrucomicrobiae bacterium]|jgi:mutator protein MutT|nr:(deoxy)nucleoside triphosphate pyrophosphohydrolase [Verrucomicrobiae bacterium]
MDRRKKKNVTARKKIRIIDVGCAIIRKKDKLLIAQRNPEDTYGNYWEFPGGKMEDCETIEECLAREVKEELGVRIKARKHLFTKFHPYVDRKLRLYFYLCDWISGKPAAHDCQGFAFVEPEELVNYKFPPADDTIIRHLIRKRVFYFGKKSAQKRRGQA